MIYDNDVYNIYICMCVYKTIYIIYIVDTCDQLAGPKKGPPESDTGPVGLVPNSLRNVG